MSERAAEQSENQAIQRQLIERARNLPGVAQVIEVYGTLSTYTAVMVNVQPEQARNATGGNAS